MTPTEANLFSSVLALTLTGGEVITFTLANIAVADINVGITLAEATPLALTFPAGTAEADIFAITTDITNPGLSPLESVIDGAGGTDVLEINTRAVVASVAFADTPPTDGVVNLQNIETITLGGGRVTGNIDASAAPTAITFNLTSGTIGGDVTGTAMVDSFVIGAGITIGGMLDGGDGEDVLSLATGFTPATVESFRRRRLDANTHRRRQPHIDSGQH